jgi:hypothetical protein
MLSWLIGVAVFMVLWAGLWRSQPKAAFGVLLGLPLAWILSLLIKPYVTGMDEFPIWLAPLPIAIIALVLFVFGAYTWLRADNLPPPKVREKDEHGHGDHGGHGHGGHGHGGH